LIGRRTAAESNRRSKMLCTAVKLEVKKRTPGDALSSRLKIPSATVAPSTVLSIEGWFFSRI
jgi:hypothetical protein